MSEHTDRINALERLPRRRSPERDLWPQIEARLAPRHRSRWPAMQLALAASLVAGLAVVFTLSLSRAPQPFTGGEDVASTLPLPNHSRAIVQANLSMVEHAQRQLRDAIRHEPDSPGLQSMLANAENRERALRAML